MSRRYSTDLTDAQWALDEPLITSERPRGRRRSINLRRIVEVIVCLNKNGCTWEDPPHDFPNPHMVYSYFARWHDDGTLEAIYQALHRRWHREQGRVETPSAAMTDTQSMQTATETEEQGNDRKKQVKGRKRHLMIDTEGFARGGGGDEGLSQRQRGRAGAAGDSSSAGASFEARSRSGPMPIKAVCMKAEKVLSGEI